MSKTTCGRNNKQNSDTLSILLQARNNSILVILIGLQESHPCIFKKKSHHYSVQGQIYFLARVKELIGAGIDLRKKKQRKCYILSAFIRLLLFIVK